jgi:hypothetical protein
MAAPTRSSQINYERTSAPVSLIAAPARVCPNKMCGSSSCFCYFAASLTPVSAYYE